MFSKYNQLDILQAVTNAPAVLERDNLNRYQSDKVKRYSIVTQDTLCNSFPFVAGLLMFAGVFLWKVELEPEIGFRAFGKYIHTRSIIIISGGGLCAHLL